MKWIELLKAILRFMSGGQKPPPTPSPQPLPPSPDSRLNELFVLHQQQRQGQPFFRSSVLSSLAQAQADAMSQKKTLSHSVIGPLASRVVAAGYRFRGIGENILQGTDSPLTAFAMWMDSPPHRANILDQDFTEIGLGVTADGYWCVIFATPGSGRTQSLREAGALQI